MPVCAYSTVSDITVARAHAQPRPNGREGSKVSELMDGGKDKRGPCCLCGRHTDLTFHHLIPRKVHRRAHFRKHVPQEQLQAGVALCRPCHKAVHRLFDEMTLARELNTLEALRAAPAMQRHIQWVRKQRIGAQRHDID